MPDLKQEFLEAATCCNTFRGFSSLCSWLLRETDYLTAPASTKYHGAYEGGLARHSLNVARRLQGLTERNGIAWERPESPVLIGLLHDLCKCNFYAVSEKNAKNETTGKWGKVPYYIVDDKMPLGHGEKSIILAGQFIRLTMEETMCIRWHMGAYEGGGSAALSTATAVYPNIIWTQAADMLASYVDESTKDVTT